MNLYHAADPWENEPPGLMPKYAFFLRKSAVNRQSCFRFQYPETGYVACPHWEGDDYFERPGLAGFILNGGGLWGYLHARGDWTEAEGLYPGGVYQLCKVKLSECRIGYGESYRVPRLWVVLTTTERDRISEYLRKVGGPYCEAVRQNFLWPATDIRYAD